MTHHPSRARPRCSPGAPTGPVTRAMPAVASRSRQRQCASGERREAASLVKNCFDTRPDAPPAATTRKPSITHHQCGGHARLEAAAGNVADIKGSARSMKSRRSGELAASPGAAALKALARHGVIDPNAFATSPSDSFPGMVAQVTGATSKTTSVFYDDSYDRSLPAEFDLRRPAGCGDDLCRDDRRQPDPAVRRRHARHPQTQLERPSCRSMSCSAMSGGPSAPVHPRQHDLRRSSGRRGCAPLGVEQTSGVRDIRPARPARPDRRRSRRQRHAGTGLTRELKFVHASIGRFVAELPKQALSDSTPHHRQGQARPVADRPVAARRRR